MLDAYIYYTNDENVTYYTHYSFGKYTACVDNGGDRANIAEVDTLEDAQANISMHADSYNLTLTDEGIVGEDGYIEIVN